MMKKYFAFIALFCMLLWHAQTATVAPSPANCTGQGSALVTTTGVTNPNFQFRDSGGTTILTNTTGIISSLDAGNYSVVVTGESGFIQTIPFVIDNTYKPIPAANILISGLCDNTFTLGGTLTVTMPVIPGKSYEYKVVKTLNVNFLESEAAYMSLTTPYTVGSFGVYQVRIKDECGEIVTITRNIQPTLAPINDFYMEALNNQACGSGTFQIKNLGFITDAGVRVSVSEYAALGGIKVEMWENPNPSGTGCPTAVPSTPAIYENIFNSTGPTGPTDASFVIPVVPSGRYLIRVTTPCGEERIMCDNMIYSTTPRMDAVAVNAGCGSSETLTISGKENNFLNFPVNVVVRNSANAIVYTYTAGDPWLLDNWSIGGLPMGDYTVTYTDECNVSLQDIVLSPDSNTDPITLTIHTSLNKCKREDPLAGTTITGTTQVTVIFNGYVENSVNAVVTILSGPSNVGVAGVRDIDTPGYLWDNMLPGNYVVQIDTLCGGVQTFPFTLSATDPNLLRQSVVSEWVSYCSGGGTITSTVVYNGLYPTTVELLNSAGAVIQTSNSGSFSNIAAGTYYTRLRIKPYCGSGSNEYYVGFTTRSPGYFFDNNLPIPTTLIPIVLSDQSTGVQVTKKIGIICEDVSGAPTSTGSAYFEVSAVFPITVEYRPVGSTGAYTSMIVNSANFQINGLLANTTYDVRFLSCGGVNTTEVTIQTPGVIKASNSVHPCVGSPYTLTLPEYVGATYEWKNPAGVVVSNTRNYAIANYAATNDGTYTGTISWGTCMVRIVTLTLDSRRCGDPIDEFCTEMPLGGTPDGFTKVGITTKPKLAAWPENIPNGFITLESENKGFVITRIANSNLVSEPKKGMLIYDIAAECVKLYNGTEWNCIKRGCNK